MSGKQVERVAEGLAERVERLEAAVSAQAETPMQADDVRREWQEVLAQAEQIDPGLRVRLEYVERGGELGHWAYAWRVHGGRPCSETCSTCRGWTKPTFRRGGVVLPPILLPVGAAPAGAGRP